MLLDRVRQEIKDYYLKQIDPNASDHIIFVAQSIFLHKEGILRGGGFVQAFCDDSLSGVLSKGGREVIDSLHNLAIFNHNFTLSLDLRVKINEQ